MNKKYDIGFPAKLDFLGLRKKFQEIFLRTEAQEEYEKNSYFL